MFVFNKLNRFICIRLSNANKIQTINPEIMNKTTRLLGSLLIITIATSCGTGGKNQSAQTDDPLANSPIVGQYNPTKEFDFASKVKAEVSRREYLTIEELNGTYHCHSKLFQILFHTLFLF